MSRDLKATAMPQHDIEAPETEPPVEVRPQPKRQLTPAARRALAEAEARRRAARQEARRAEIGGRGGLDPSRYGDWEIKGRAIDF
jgi:hypothetical protein